MVAFVACVVYTPLFWLGAVIFSVSHIASLGVAVWRIRKLFVHGCLSIGCSIYGVTSYGNHFTYLVHIHPDNRQTKHKYLLLFFII